VAHPRFASALRAAATNAAIYPDPFSTGAFDPGGHIDPLRVGLGERHRHIICVEAACQQPWFLGFDRAKQAPVEALPITPGRPLAWRGLASNSK